MPGAMTDKILPFTLTFDPDFLSGEAYARKNEANPLYDLANEFRKVYARLDDIFDPEVDDGIVNELSLDLKDRQTNQALHDILLAHKIKFLDFFSELSLTTENTRDGQVRLVLPRAIVRAGDLHLELTTRLKKLVQAHPEDEALIGVVRMLPFADVSLSSDVDDELGRGAYRFSDALPAQRSFKVRIDPELGVRPEDMIASLRRSSKFSSLVRRFSLDSKHILLEASDRVENEDDLYAGLESSLNESGDEAIRRMVRKPSFRVEKEDINLNRVRDVLRSMHINDPELADAIIKAILQGMGAWQFEVGATIDKFIILMSDNFIANAGEQLQIRIEPDDDGRFIQFRCQSQMTYSQPFSGGFEPMGTLKAGFRLDVQTRKVICDPITMEFVEGCTAVPSIQRNLEHYGQRLVPVVERPAPQPCKSYQDYQPTQATPTKVAHHYGVQTTWEKIKSKANDAIKWCKANPVTSLTVLAGAAAFVLAAGISAALLLSGVGTPLGIALTAMSVDLAIGDLGLLFISSAVCSSIVAGVTFGAKKMQQASIKMKNLVPKKVKPNLVGHTMQLVPPKRLEKDRLDELLAGLNQHSVDLDVTAKPAKDLPPRSASAPSVLDNFQTYGTVPSMT